LSNAGMISNSRVSAVMLWLTSRTECEVSTVTH
jgi:hypothetical protein